MPSITIIENELKKYEGTTFNSFADMCQALVLINGKPCAKGMPIGSYQKTIERELQSFAKISIQQAAKGRNKLITIEKVFTKQQAVSSVRAGEANITEYLRPILWEMVNNEYQNVCFIKNHKDLTVQLKYLGVDYIKLYNALFNEFFCFGGIQNNDNFTRHIMEKFVGKIIGYITYNCKNLNYEGVSTDKIPIKDKANLECLDFSDQQLYDKFKQDAKTEIDKEKEPIKEIIPDITIDYRSIPLRAVKKFNDYKKLLDINHMPIELDEAWTFDIDGNFKPIPQAINPKILNDELLNVFLESAKYETLYIYAKSPEFQKLKSNLSLSFTGVDASHCSVKEVRQALTKANRDNKAKRKKTEEINIPLDFSLYYLESYLDDIRIIYNACKI